MLISSNKIKHSLLTLTAVLISTMSPGNSANSANFGQKEVEQNNFIAVAMPFHVNRYQLLILEQMSNQQACWSENGYSPIQVEPLLLNFDFTGICGRSTDTNGYSIRKSGEDLGWQYNIEIVKEGDELLLLGTPVQSPDATPMLIGRTNGITDGFVKINLEPGWRFTKRTYKDKTLGHIYLTNDN
ncbi:MAG TPA: DUF3747 domain-containing protein [Oculatellaceae cyanobacterium]|jgi:N-acetylmuramoyl-L-alanine amidase